MLGALLCWGAMYVVFTGWGQLIRFALPRSIPGFSNEHFWIGFALCIAFLQIWHLWLPVDWPATVAVVALGLAGAIWKFKDLPKPHSGQPKLFMAVSAFILVWTVNQCLAAPYFFDAGLYYFQSIRWLNEHAIVPGLGNLHGRLAFNQSYFLFPAVLNASPWFGKGYHLANGFLVVVLAIQLLHRLLSPGSLRVRLFSAFMLVVVLKQAQRESLSSPMPDVAIFILGVLLMLWFVEFLESARASANWTALALIAVLGITFKLSFLGFGFATAALAFVMIKTASQPNLLLRSATVGLLIGGVWVARGVITSGYPIYPSTAAGMAIDWKIPEPKVAAMRKSISQWARSPGPKGAGQEPHWFKPWLARTLKNSQVNRPLTLFALAGLALISWRGKSPKLPRELWAPLLPPLVWLAFWFLTAPDPRFARAALWLLAGWAVVLLVTRVATARQWNEVRVLQIFMAVALLLVLPGTIRKAAFVRDLRGFGHLPQTPLRDYHTASGLKVYVPVGDNRAWNAPLPSTPLPDITLELRASTLAGGFRSKRNATY